MRACRIDFVLTEKLRRVSELIEDLRDDLADIHLLPHGMATPVILYQALLTTARKECRHRTAQDLRPGYCKCGPDILTGGTGTSGIEAAV